MLVLGIDPGTAVTGYGLVREETNRMSLVDCGTIRTEADHDAVVRLKKIYQVLEALIREYNPDQVAIEKVFFNKNVRSAMSVGQARGVCMLAAALNEVKVHHFTPPQIKAAVTGYGDADKKQVQEMVRILLGLSECPRPDDTADALATAICCLNSGGFSRRVGGKR